MINADFYPTPQPVIEKMLEGITSNDFHSWNILDPSAGKGDILDFLSERSGRYARLSRFNAIEIDAELRAVLKEKSYRIIDTDFMAYDGTGLFDLIIMNPPFNEGATHLLKAWDISKGALIKCLLNAETIRNPYSAERKQLAALIEKHGSVEFLGQCFKDAERPTHVEVALVTLQDPTSRKAWQMEYEPLKTAEFKAEAIADELAPHDVFASYEQQYQATVAAFEEMLLAQQKLLYYGSGLVKSYCGSERLRDLAGKALKEKPKEAYRNFVSELSESAWAMIFNKTKLAQVTTTKVSREIETMQKEQGAMAFTAQNMDALFYGLALSRGNIMVECIESVFDALTKHYPENREEVEGWKTNCAYKVGKRFIIPYMISYNSLNYEKVRLLDDIDKALCFVAGRRFEEIKSVSSLYYHLDYRLPFGELLESTFFRVRLYKKGTMHFEFKEEFLRQEFNRIVAEKRQWLPEKAKKGAFI